MTPSCRCTAAVTLVDSGDQPDAPTSTAEVEAFFARGWFGKR